MNAFVQHPQFKILVFGTLAMGLFASVVSLAIVAIPHSLQRARVSACAGNLSQLWKMKHIYAVQFGSRDGGEWKRSHGQGREFWAVLTRTQPPLIDSSTADLFLCPAFGTYFPGDLQYLGPAESVYKKPDSTPVGSDDWNNHPAGGGNVLYKSGELVELPRAEWTAFLERGECAP